MSTSFALLALLTGCSGSLGAPEVHDGPTTGDAGTGAGEDSDPLRPGTDGSGSTDGASGPGNETDLFAPGSPTEPSGSPGSPDGDPAGDGMTPNVNGPSPAAPSASSPSEAGLGTFSRLTRAEYLATVRGALGVETDRGALPEDGRIGPFTSNASVHPDPVHPYLLVAENLAQALVPSVFEACGGAGAAACLEREWRTPLERLYRRSVSDGELSEWARMIAELEETGASPEQATRTMLAAALTGPDFLFRSAFGGSEVNASVRRIAERISYVLWDEPPDAELSAQPSGSSAELSMWLVDQARRLSQDERATAVLSRFLGQWLDVDTDLRLEEPAFGNSPAYLELLAFTRDAMQNQAPVTAFVGLLAEELLASSTRHPDVSRRVIFRGLLVRRALLCDPIPTPSADLVALAAEVGDRTQDPRCAGCHVRLDPIGGAFGVLDPGGITEPAEVIGHAELEGTYADLGELLDAVAGSRAFAECFSKHWLEFFLEQPLRELDPIWVALLADAVEAGASLTEVVRLSVGELSSRSETFVPWCGVE